MIKDWLQRYVIDESVLYNCMLCGEGSMMVEKCRRWGVFNNFFDFNNISCFVVSNFNTYYECV